MNLNINMCTERKSIMKNILSFCSTLSLAFVLSLALSPSTAIAADVFEITTVIKDHKFNPSEIRVPAGKKIKLTVDNQDDTIEEFDSQPLNRERTINGHEKGVVIFGPLEKGSYSYIGEFNEKTAFGVIIAE